MGDEYLSANTLGAFWLTVVFGVVTLVFIQDALNAKHVVGSGYWLLVVTFGIATMISFGFGMLFAHEWLNHARSARRETSEIR